MDAYPRVAQDARWLAAQRARPGFLLADISGGKEARQLPVFNEVDGEGPPAGLTYVRDSVAGSHAAARLLEEGRRVMPATWCGRQQGRAKCYYTQAGLLTTVSER